MQRFVSKRSSSTVDLASSSASSLLNDVRAKRALGRPRVQQRWERALEEPILHHREFPHGVRSQRAGWWRPGETIARLLTHEEIAYTSTPCAALTAPATQSAALVEDEPRSSTAKRREVHVDPTVRNWFLDLSHQWKTERQWDTQRCLCEVKWLRPGIFNGINQNTLYRWKRSEPRAAPLGRKTLLSPADMTRLSEHIMRVTDVLCLSGLTIRSLMLDWLDAEGRREVRDRAPQP